MTATNVETHLETVVIPPDGGWGWFVVFTAFTWNIIVDGTVYTFGLFIDEMRNDFKVSPSLLSLASSIQLGVYFMLAPFIAAMINRLGFRVVSMLGGTLAFAGLLTSAYLTNIYAFIFAYGGLLGIAFSMTYLSNILVVGFYFSKYRALATCIAVTGTAVGVSIFPVIFSVGLPGIGWREKYKYISGAHLFMAFMGLVYRPIPTSDVVVQGAAQDGRSESSAMWNVSDYKRNRDFPTNAEVLQNQEYTVLPYGIESNTSFKSSRTARSTRFSMAAVRSVQLDMPKIWFRRCCCCRCKCKYLLCPCLWHDHRPMYRDDILYHGSTRTLAQYNRNLSDDDKARMQYQMSVTRTATMIDTSENADCCNCCPDSVTRVIQTMLDMTLLKSFAFLLLCLSGFFTYLGLYVPYIYGIELSISHNVERVKATYILTAIGLSNALGRMLYGLFTMIPRIDAMIISQVTLCLAGVAMVAHPFFHQFSLQLTCACVFGLNIATISSLRTIVVVDLLGLEKLTNAFGLIVLMEGLASLVALPLSSYLYETQQGYLYPFVFAGCVVILSGLLLIPVGPMYRAEQRRKERREKLERLEKFVAAAKAATAPTASGRAGRS